MKKLNSLLILLIMSLSLQAQTELYEFSIQYIGVNAITGHYQMALIATPDADVNNQLSSDLGSMISVPNGYTIGNFEDGTSGIAASEFNSDDYGQISDAGDPTFYLNRLVTTSNIFFTFTSGTPIQLVRFDVIGAGLPTSGFVTLVPPGDNSRLGFLLDYINLTDGATTTDRYGSKSSTNNTFNFASLKTTESVFANLSIFPNPVIDTIYINNVKNIDEINIINVNGQVVKQFTNDLEKLDVSELSSGVYFLSIISQDKMKRIKIIKD